MVQFHFDGAGVDGAGVDGAGVDCADVDSDIYGAVKGLLSYYRHRNFECSHHHHVNYL